MQSLLCGLSFCCSKWNWQANWKISFSITWPGNQSRMDENRFALLGEFRIKRIIWMAIPNGLNTMKAWPRGRTNHYCWPQNRDWLPGYSILNQEIRVKVSGMASQKIHAWFSSEMGELNSTFLLSAWSFPPRVAPLWTPNKNFWNWPKKMRNLHDRSIDQIGSLYYNQKKDTNDFYYGKESTYPDVQGSNKGFLFEQAVPEVTCRKAAKRMFELFLFNDPEINSRANFLPTKQPTKSASGGAESVDWKIFYKRYCPQRLLLMWIRPTFLGARMMTPRSFTWQFNYSNTTSKYFSLKWGHTVNGKRV